ncbi:hypothetical protein ABID44_002108 [Aquamicrobium ahrensii]|uniref:Uncharacterized protein n=1 Tax=Aquamicrobium ahrensii TaxID=469551 RepID=A0ABV2KMG8_9HYPH
MVVDVRAHLDLFDLDDLLVLAGFRRLLLGGVFQLAQVEDLGDRRIGVGGNLNEVQPGLFGEQEGFAGGNFAAVVAVGIDKLDAGDLDVPVSARPFLGGRCCFERSANGRILLELLIRRMRRRLCRKHVRGVNSTADNENHHNPRCQPAIHIRLLRIGKSRGGFSSRPACATTRGLNRSIS